MTNINKLNHDCLAYIFGFFGPKEWISLSKVCKKWDSAMTFCWKTSFKLMSANERKFEAIKNTTKSITLEEVNEIIKKTGLKLKHVSLLVDKGDYKSREILCFFGNYYYCINSKFLMKNIVKMLSLVCENLKTLRIQTIEDNDCAIWKKLFEKNKELTIFKITTKICNFPNNSLLLNLPKTLEKIKLRFKKKFNIPYNKNYEQLLQLVKQLKMTHIHIEAPFFKDDLITLLLKHQKNLKSLCLIANTETRVTSEKFIEISNLVELERIHFSGHLPVNDEFIINILRNCPNICEIKLGGFYLSDKVLAIITSLPNLKKLRLEDLPMITRLPCPVEMRKLQTLKLIHMNSSFDFISLSNAVNQMPVLSKLTIIVMDSMQTSYIESLFTIVNSILYQNKYVIIEKCCFFQCFENIYCEWKDGAFELISQMKIYEKDSCDLPEDRCFMLSLTQECLDNFTKNFSYNRSLWTNWKVEPRLTTNIKRF